MFPRCIIVITLYKPATPTTLASGSLLATRVCNTMEEAETLMPGLVAKHINDQLNSTQFGDGVSSVQGAIFVQDGGPTLAPSPAKAA